MTEPTEKEPENPEAPAGPDGTADLSEGSTRRRRIGIALVALLALAALGIVLFNQLRRPDDVSNPTARFDRPVAPEPRPKKPVDETVNWPTFRFDRQRTGYLDAPKVKPPFKRVWRYGAKPLLEFPPIVVDGVLYLVDNDGHAFALRADNGKEVWRRRVARLNAATPTWAEGRLYMVNMDPGQVQALRAKNGRTVWKRKLPCRSESSPVVVHRRVYFGCEDGRLYALKARNGKEVWSTVLGGAIKAAPAYRGGVLFVGDYGGSMNAVRARDGKILWQSRALGPGLGKAGSFYSTPAVAWGRVYSGNNDSRVYSFDAKTGELAWSHSTGGWVYSGPSAARVPGTPPTVYIGSFDGNVYALDARSGDTRWTFNMNGRVIGSLSVIGRNVYAATFDGTRTYGIDAKTGKQTFSYHTGAYMPAISDGVKLYLIGYSSIHALQPVTRKQLRRQRQRKLDRKRQRRLERKRATKRQQRSAGAGKSG